MLILRWWQLKIKSECDRSDLTSADLVIGAISRFCISIETNICSIRWKVAMTTSIDSVARLRTDSRTEKSDSYVTHNHLRDNVYSYDSCRVGKKLFTVTSLARTDSFCCCFLRAFFDVCGRKARAMRKQPPRRMQR